MACTMESCKTIIVFCIEIDAQNSCMLHKNLDHTWMIFYAWTTKKEGGNGKSPLTLMRFPETRETGDLKSPNTSWVLVEYGQFLTRSLLEAFMVLSASKSFSGWFLGRRLYQKPEGLCWSCTRSQPASKSGGQLVQITSALFLIHSAPHVNWPGLVIARLVS